jgi:hypothetical protein
MATTSAIERLKGLKQLLKIEREEDYRLYKEQFLRVNLDQRKKNGVTWYPIKINSEELGSGDLMHLEIERTTQIDKPHQFSSGKNVSLFSNKQDEVLEITGTIKSVSKNSLKLIIHSDELPDWCYDGKLGINIQFDDNSYNEMQLALDVVINANNNRIAELREMIEGTLPISFQKTNNDIIIPQLNLSQNKAVRHVLSVNDIGVIHGPPGTGKTTSLVQAIRLTLQTENQILVCAPTNSAVDLITEKLIELGANGYYIKESPEYILSPRFSKDNYDEFIKTIQSCLSRKPLKQIYTLSQKIKSIIESLVKDKKLDRGFGKSVHQYIDLANKIIDKAKIENDYAMGYIVLFKCVELINDNFIVQDTFNNWQITIDGPLKQYGYNRFNNTTYSITPVSFYNNIPNYFEKIAGFTSQVLGFTNNEILDLYHNVQRRHKFIHPDESGTLTPIQLAENKMIFTFEGYSKLIRSLDLIFSKLEMKLL